LTPDWCNQRAETIDAGYDSRTPRLRTHTCVLSRAESGYISFYTEDDLEGDEADVEQNGTPEPCLFKLHALYVV
jgi:hypothetical protein